TSGCFPNFDGLSGESPSDASSQVDAPAMLVDAPLTLADALDACGSRCADGEPPDCVNPSAYPGGGLHKADFSDVSDLILNGAARVTNGILQVSVDNNSSGSAFVSAPFVFDAQTSVFAHFKLRIGGGAGLNGSDGLAFIMQNSSDGAN